MKMKNTNNTTTNTTNIEVKKFDTSLMNVDTNNSIDINKLIARDIKKVIKKIHNIKVSATSSIYGIKIQYDDFFISHELVEEIVGHYSLLTSDTIYINNRIAYYSNTIESKEIKEKEYKKQEEENEKKYKARQKLYNDNVKIDKIVNFKEIDTTNKFIFVKALEPSINKNNWKVENDKMIDESSYINKYKVEKIVILDIEEYNYFKFNLLTDYVFLHNQGGTITDDTTNKMLYNLAVAIVCDGQETLIIDPQGFSYARYTCRLIEDITGDLQKEIKETVFCNNVLLQNRIDNIKDNSFYIYSKYGESYSNVGGSNVDRLVLDDKLILDDSYHCNIIVSGMYLKELINRCDCNIKPIEKMEINDINNVIENLKKVDLGLIRCLLDTKDRRVRSVKMFDRFIKEYQRVNK